MQTLAPAKFGHFNTNPRRRLPYSTRHSSFNSQSEAISFFRADVQPLQETKQKKEFFSLQKKLVAGELHQICKSKQDLLHKSLKLFFKIHFLADKRSKRAEARLQEQFRAEDAEYINVDDEEFGDADQEENMFTIRQAEANSDDGAIDLLLVAKDQQQ